MDNLHIVEEPMVNIAVLVATHEYRHVIKHALHGGERHLELEARGFELHEVHPMYRDQWELYKNYDQKYLDGVLT